MIFYNSSMPRSGSTLLQNILAQNPEVHATPTDGSLELLFGARYNFTNSPEFAAQDTELMTKAWRGFCKGGLEGYVKNLSDKPHTCIKSRGIGNSYDWYSAFMGEDIKVLCTVRDIRAILSSMEKIFRKDSERARDIENPGKMSGTTTEKRVDIWLQSPPVGMALERFQQMAKEGINRKCKMIKFERLTTDPETVMKEVYEYLELPYFKHDFNNVEQITVEDDAAYGLTSDLHKVRKEIKPIPMDYNKILGKDLSNHVHKVCGGYQSDFGYF